MTTRDQSTETPPSSPPRAYAERLFGAVLAARRCRRSTSATGSAGTGRWPRARPLTSAELAARTGTAERYAREWLEHQAVCGVLLVDDPSRGRPAASVHPAGRPCRGAGRCGQPEPRRCRWPGSSPASASTWTRWSSLPSGRGVSWAELGDDPREAQAAANRPMFLGALGSEYLPPIPDVARRAARRRPGGRHRLRVRLVVDRHRAGVPGGERRRLRRGRAVDRGGRPKRRRGRSRRPGAVPPADAAQPRTVDPAAGPSRTTW